MGTYSLSTRLNLTVRILDVITYNYILNYRVRITALKHRTIYAYDEFLKDLDEFPSVLYTYVHALVFPPTVKCPSAGTSS